MKLKQLISVQDNMEETYYLISNFIWFDELQTKTVCL